MKRSALYITLCSALTLAACTPAPRYRNGPADYGRPPAEVSLGDRSVSVSGNDIVDRAQRYIGTPYRMGGASERGMDCSGLVFNVFRSIGVALPRTSRAQARFGAKIPRSRLQPGDLVFFATSGGSRVSHVGIYSGRGEFIHASTRSRKVRFDRLDNKYFEKRFVVARRVL